MLTGLPSTPPLWREEKLTAPSHLHPLPAWNTAPPRPDPPRPARPGPARSRAFTVQKGWALSSRHWWQQQQTNKNRSGTEKKMSGSLYYCVSVSYADTSPITPRRLELGSRTSPSRPHRERSAGQNNDKGSGRNTAIKGCIGCLRPWRPGPVFVRADSRAVIGLVETQCDASRLSLL